MMKKKGGLSKRYKSSYESKDSGGGKSGVMNFKNLNREIEFFSPSEGRNRINIIPYEIKTKNHPLVRKGEFEVGDKDYVMDVFVHKFIGPTESTVLCLKSTFGKPCPICEQSALLKKQGKDKESSDLKASRRVFYNVEDLKNPGIVKVFETSHFLFEKELIDEARGDDGDFIDFADEESGKEVKFRCLKVKKGGFEFNEFKSFDFDDREEPLSEDLIENAISFDEILNVPTYEEAEKILFGSDDDEEDEKHSKKNPNREDDEGSEDGEEFETPKKSPKNRDEDDSEESCDKCPFNHKFGKDCDEHDDCNDCDCWDKCCKAKKNK